jgi:hypothetical protein
MCSKLPSFLASAQDGTERSTSRLALFTPSPAGKNPVSIESVAGWIPQKVRKVFGEKKLTRYGTKNMTLIAKINTGYNNYKISGNYNGDTDDKKNFTVKRVTFLLHILEVRCSILGPVSGFLE